MLERAASVSGRSGQAAKAWLSWCRPRRGPVSQLGARLNGIQKVRASNPLGSTKLDLTAPIDLVGHGQDHVASFVALVDIGVGLGHLLERVRPVDDRFERALSREAGQRVQV